MTRTRGALLVAAVAGLLILPPLGQRVLAPSDEVRFVLYAQETLQQRAAFDVHVRAKRFPEKLRPTASARIRGRRRDRR